MIAYVCGRMPVTRNADLPATVRSALPADAQTIWRDAFNAASESGETEQSSIRTAWIATAKDGWMSGGGSKWRRPDADLAGPIAWSASVEIQKFDEEKRMITGWLSIANDLNGNPVIDAHGDIIPVEELESAARGFMMEYRQAGVMHRKFDGVGSVVESFVFTNEKMEAMGIPKGIVPEGWIITMHVEDAEVWDAVKRGELSMFSLGGVAISEDAGMPLDIGTPHE